MKKRGDKKPNVALRTWHYYWQEIKKYKWYSLTTLALTPLITFIRGILAPILFADLIEKVSMGVSGEELWRLAAVDIIGFSLLSQLAKLHLNQFASGQLGKWSSLGFMTLPRCVLTP